MSGISTSRFTGHDEEPVLVGLDDTCMELDVSVEALFHFIEDRLLKPHYPYGRCGSPRFDQAEIKALIADQEALASYRDFPGPPEFPTFLDCPWADRIGPENQAGAVEANARIGTNLAALRGANSLNAVAASMARRGWGWTAGTAWAVERGTRTLTLLEAEDLASILQCSISSLLAQPVAIRLAEAAKGCSRADEQIQTAVAAYLDAQDRLATMFGLNQIPNPEMHPLFHWLEREPQRAVETATDRWRQAFERHQAALASLYEAQQCGEVEVLPEAGPVVLDEPQD